MSDSDRTDDSWSLGRRTALKLTGGIVLGGASAGNAVAGGRERTKHKCYIKQGGKAYEIEPLEGDVPVEELYDYRLPGKYEGVGVTSTEGPHYRSVGTKDLQKEATSIMFLYDGPDGLSFVVVHGRPGGKGGSVSFKVTSVPEDAKWTVKDDLYVDADTGERVSSNYDKWETDGTKHHIDWTWGSHGTDGGVLSHLGKKFALTIHPAFNKDAELYGEHYSGWVEDWQILSGNLDDPDRASLDLDEPVTVACRTSKQKQSWEHKWDDDHDKDEKHRRDDKDRKDHDDEDKKHRHDDKDHKDRKDHDDEDDHGKGHDKGRGRGHDKGRGRGHDKGHGGKHDDEDGKSPGGYQKQSQKQSQYQSGSGTQVQSQSQSQKQAQTGGSGTQAQSQSQSQTQVQAGGNGLQVQQQNQSQTQVQKLLNKVTGSDD